MRHDRMRQEHKYDAAIAHLQAGRTRPAEVALRAVVAVNPRSALAHYHLGLALRGQHKWKAAAQAFRSALAFDPHHARAEASLALMLLQTTSAAAAEPHVRRAAANDPGDPLILAALGNILRHLGRLAEARTAFDAALKLSPDHVDARFGRGFLSLLEGDYASGLVDYEFREARTEGVDPGFAPQWRGEDIRGRALLVYGEQGLGDGLQFLRFLPPLVERGVRVTAMLPAPLTALARASLGGVRVLEPGDRSSFDVCCPLPSLPLYCGIRLEAIPARAGYLTVPPGRMATWSARLGESADLTVALVWAGNPEHTNDHNRSMTLADLAPLLRISGVRWISLQKGPAAADLSRRLGVLDLGGELKDFADTAAVMAQADLVVSVDSAPCHLAGALGRPVWTMIPFAPDWRWGVSGTDTAWYGSMRLYRQAALEEGWSLAVEAAARDLAALVSARA
ncbi:tetratricopeptide repeat protein [Caulobacter sp. CCNWLY153]|uniref:tetratricopeptide repeat protein n=1 Tax=unclassified Caulobacter TaxID=2648921 RepID=UPI002FEF7B7F